jgi:hypothetical protein
MTKPHIPQGPRQSTKGKRRRLKIPDDGTLLLSFGGWNLYDRSEAPGDNTSPLWPSVKAVHIDRKDDRRRGLGRRAYWLRYGVEAGRFRRCYDNEEFSTRFPAVHAAFEARCREVLTPDKIKRMKLGGSDLEYRKAVARLKTSTDKRVLIRGEQVEVFRVGEWTVSRIDRPDGSPLWVRFSAFAPGRVMFGLGYGVTARRLVMNRKLDMREQSEPDIAAVRAAVLAYGLEHLSEEKVRAKVGEEAWAGAVTAEEVRVAADAVNAAERYEKAHYEALDMDWRRRFQEGEDRSTHPWGRKL